MSQWYYYDPNGNKIGPTTSAALKSLVQQGLVTPETIIQTERGATVLAKSINGLVFPLSSKQVPPVLPSPPRPSSGNSVKVEIDCFRFFSDKAVYFCMVAYVLAVLISGFDGVFLAFAAIAALGFVFFTFERIIFRLESLMGILLSKDDTK